MCVVDRKTVVGIVNAASKCVCEVCWLGQRKAKLSPVVDDVKSSDCWIWFGMNSGGLSRCIAYWLSANGRGVLTTEQQLLLSAADIIATTTGFVRDRHSLGAFCCLFVMDLASACERERERDTLPLIMNTHNLSKNNTTGGWFAKGQIYNNCRLQHKYKWTAIVTLTRVGRHVWASKSRWFVFWFLLHSPLKSWCIIIFAQTLPLHSG